MNASSSKRLSSEQHHDLKHTALQHNALQNDTRLALLVSVVVGKSHK